MAKSPQDDPIGAALSRGLQRRPLITGALGMGLFDFLGLKPTVAATPTTEAATPAPVTWPQGAVAQLVGANLISNMFDQGWGIEKYLPQLLEPGPNGKAPKPFTKIARGNGEFRPKGRYNADEKYIGELCLGFQFVVSYYGKDVQGFNMFMWNGVRMNGLPVVAGFTAERTEAEARDILEEGYRYYGLTSKPVITLASGNSGWTTLETGWQMIATPAAKVIWQATVDSPSYPKNKEPNEAAVLLMVAHPAYDAGRKPLAYFSAPQVVTRKDVQRVEGESSAITALRQAVLKVCAAAGIAPQAIGTVATDCGRETPTASKRLGEVGAALHTLLPELDVLNDRIDMVALLGELGANTVNYTLLMAAYAAHQRNHPVLYLSSVDSDAGRAMLVFPPRDHTPPDPNRAFREHNPRGQWYAPWWGQRLDGKLDY